MITQSDDFRGKLNSNSRSNIFSILIFTFHKTMDKVGFTDTGITS